jgi:twitching motility protein PilT
MVEFVLGTGHQTNLQVLFNIVVEQLTKTQGVPRSVTVAGNNTVIVGEREDFKGDFTSFNLRLTVPPDIAVKLSELASAAPGDCALAQKDGCLELTVPPAGKPYTSAHTELLAKVIAAIAMPDVWRISGDKYRIDVVSVEKLFQAMIQYKASDVHLSPGETPVFRVDGQTLHSEIMGRLSSVQIFTLIKQIASDDYWQEFERDKQTSFNFHQAGLGYSRVSAFLKSAAPHCTLRFLPETIPSFEDLSIPRNIMIKLANLHHGLVLITGMTGSGKTTTSAALLDYINANKTLHVLTIENPIEYVHTNKKSIVSQRSLGMDVATFNLAVTGALRHDPDVIFIGEMRDPDTIRSAINAAATGHLVVSTLHSNTAYEVVNRIVSFFDPVERDLVRLQLRDCIKAVICQRLVPKLGGGRVPALEIMFNDIKPINDGIVAGETDAIRIGMQQTVGESFLFEDYLHRLFKNGKIDLAKAQMFCTDQSIFDQMQMGTYSVPRLDSIKELRHAK